MVSMVTSVERDVTVDALAALSCENRLDVGAGEGTFGRHFSSASGSLYRFVMLRVFGAPALRGGPVAVRMVSSPFNRGRSSRFSVGFPPSIHLRFDASGISSHPLGVACRSLVSVFGVGFGDNRLPALRVVRAPLSVVRVATRSLRRSLIGCYSLVSHVERLLVRLVRSVAAPGPGCDASLYLTVGPQHQG